MRSRSLALLLLFIFILSCSLESERAQAQPRAARKETRATRGSVPAPEDVLGFHPGDDRKLASWREVIEYFKRLDAASDRLRFEELGRSTMNAPFVMATISAPENLARLDEFKSIQRKLADPRRLEPNPEREAAQLIARGKTIVLITCGIHSTEVGSYLSSMLIAHRLASSNEPLIRAILRDTIVLLVPSLNPDGVDIVKNWYDKTLGTPFEGTEPPTLYHKYVGHDNNRDWYAFTQVETEITVSKIHNIWHPQIVHDIHQQGEFGSRLFLPPYMPPVEPNVPPQIVEGYTELGDAIAREMRAAGFKGITTNTTYDAWTPARAYSHYHGGVRILSETASAKLATPINVKFDELRSREGYDPHKESDKYSPLWRGGQWRLRDITNYMTSAAFSLLKHAAGNRERWLSRFYEIGKEAVRPRRNGELFGFLLPRPPSRSIGNESAITRILTMGGVKIESTEQGQLVRLDQPYGAFAKALLEPQRYPDLRDDEGHPIAPYDVTAHTLPLLMGVKATPVYAPFSYKTTTYWWLGGLFGCSRGVGRVAIYKSHVPSMDEGWTRWLLREAKGFPENERKCLTVSSLEDKEARTENLISKYDTIIIPDQSPRVILEGHRLGTMPTELTGGLGPEGTKRLREFVEQGGTLICLNRASNFAIEQLKLPVRDITASWKRTEFYAPGSILRTEIDTSHTIAMNMPRESIAWVENSPVFEIKSDPLALVRVKIIARYPAHADPLLSGWLLGGERIKGKAALMEVGLGQGRIYLYGFRPQYRAQSLATYPLFFNAIRPRTTALATP